ncbi:MAG: hypothetical protein R3257_03365 [bacterium]|nr:hypothetical protein [bacterium]
MPDETDFIQEVGSLVKELTDLGHQPILIGGMALVTLGSRRVTRDFDFILSKPSEDLKELVEIFYRKGLELASRINDNGDIVSTIDNPKVAAARLEIDSPASAYFLNPKTGLRIDLLFDFPIPAAELAKQAKKTKIQSYHFYIASKDDLIRLKEIALSKRSFPGDEQDLIFLKKRQKK